MPNLDPPYFYGIGIASLLIGVVFLTIGFLMSKDV